MSDRRRVALLFSGSALLQVLLCLIPDSMGDLLSYRLWARDVADHGLVAAYLPGGVTGSGRTPIDYPPVVPLLLAPVGWAAGTLRLSDAAVDTVIRLVFVLAGVVIACLLYREVQDRRGPQAAAWAAALYLFNPGVLFDTAYWGQADAVCALFVVGTALALRRRRPEWACGAFALAVLTKPVAYAFGPVVLLWTLQTFGWRRTARSAAAFAAVATVVCLPFLFAGQGLPLLRLLFVQMGAMPYASVNAHNLWWLLQGGVPWTATATKVWGHVSWQTASLVLLAAFYSATLFRLRGARDERALLLAFASVAFGFFVLATHMHENHLFPLVPLLLLVGLDDTPRLRPIFVAVSVALLANLVLHDPRLTSLFRGWTPAAQVTIPAVPVLDEERLAFLARSGYGALVEQTRGGTTWWLLSLTFVNAQLVVLTFAVWLWSFYGRGGFDGAVSEGSRLR